MLPEVNLLKRQNGKTHDQCQVFCSQSGKHLPAGLFEVYVQLDLIEALNNWEERDVLIFNFIKGDMTKKVH